VVSTLNAETRYAKLRSILHEEVQTTSKQSFKEKGREFAENAVIMMTYLFHFITVC